ncbi:MAG: SDR family oxidoreductase [Candidatus Sericytochromatia bacterium]|nr:SDR family oxidoreductase [Candidatus Sericytochromatia bacterium]
MAVLLVIGASGNVGAEIVRLLVGQGHAVRVATRSPAGASAGFSPLIEPVPFDFERPETFGPALAGVDRLFLMRPPAITDTRRFIVPVIAAARDAGVHSIVFLSLLGAEKNPLVPHHRIETALVASGVPYTLLRAGFFMQNLSTTHRADIVDLDEILVPAGRGRTSFIDVRDIAAVAVKALTEPGHTNKAYALTGDEALDYHEVAACLSTALGRPITYRQPSIFRFIARMRRRGFPLDFIWVMAAIYTTVRLGLAASVTTDTHRLLGRPAIRMRQFVADHRDLWQRAGD